MNITGASGSSGLLGPKEGWFVYVFPRGGHVAQDSTGTTITFDSSDAASRFAVNNWIQAGLLVANIRQVSGVGGNSITVSGAALTVAENDRIFLIGNTQPTTTGGSATYTIPATVIRQRDDSAADIYVNSMITTNADGLAQFWTETAALYDAIIQDGNRTNQGSIIDLNVGIAEGVNTNIASIFGATVTINANLGVTGFVTVGTTLTVHGNFGTTGYALIGTTLTVNGNMGTTGTATFGATATFVGTSGNYTHTGTALFGNTVTITGALGVTGHVQGNSDFAGRRFNINRSHITGSTYFTLSSGWGSTAAVTVLAGSVDQAGNLTIDCGGAGFASNPTIIQTPRDGSLIGDGGRGIATCILVSVSSVNSRTPISVTGSPQAWICGTTPTHGHLYSFNYIYFGTSTIT